MKLIQRIGLVFLRPRVAAWRYQRGAKSNIAANLGSSGSGGGGSGGGVAGSAAALEAQQRAAAAAAAVEAEAEADVEHAEQLEGERCLACLQVSSQCDTLPAAMSWRAVALAGRPTTYAQLLLPWPPCLPACPPCAAVIESLLTGLADRDTVVRWSAAKGMGRLAGRLPRDLGDDVVASLLEGFFTPGKQAVCPGACSNGGRGWQRGGAEGQQEHSVAAVAAVVVVAAVVAAAAGRGTRLLCGEHTLPAGLPAEGAGAAPAAPTLLYVAAGASDTAWHGGCMGLAELARRGLLLPERLPGVAPLVVRALEYDIRRGPCRCACVCCGLPCGSVEWLLSVRVSNPCIA